MKKQTETQPRKTLPWSLSSRPTSSSLWLGPSTSWLIPDYPATPLCGMRENGAFLWLEVEGKQKLKQIQEQTISCHKFQVIGFEHRLRTRRKGNKKGKHQYSHRICQLLVLLAHSAMTALTRRCCVLSVGRKMRGWSDLVWRGPIDWANEPRVQNLIVP